LVHVVLAEVLPKIAAFETLEVVVPDGPLSATEGAVSRHLAKTNSGAEDMADAVHPGGFATLEMGIYDGDPVVNLLEGEAVFWRGQDGLADKGGVGQVWLSGGVGAGGK